MSALFTSDEALFAEACDVIRLYTGEKHVEHLEKTEVRPEGLTFHVLSAGGSTRAAVYENGRIVSDMQTDLRFLPLRSSSRANAVRQKRHQAKLALYRALVRITGRPLPWGSLTGIRPVKLLRELAAAWGEDRAVSELRNSYHVSEEKISLGRDICAVQKEKLGPGSPGDCAYIGIPFCPSRCRYCSFIAQDVAGARSVRRMYPAALTNELEACGVLPSVSSVYIGGGTPTTLTVSELNDLITRAYRLFPNVREFTVEAGRPDTLTRENLRLFSDLGIGRLSINPQTSHDRTLSLIGRGHTFADFQHAMEMAQRESFIINTDMILGLPGETEEDVLQTLEELLVYMPENITVHALAVKNAAALAADRDWDRMPAPDAERAACSIRGRLAEAGYRPYYLYRQKYMSGNLENVGYTRNGKACLYNILNMEELSSVYAFGAGGISKRLLPSEGRIERAANVKDARQYTGRIAEMIRRKQELFGLPNMS